MAVYLLINSWAKLSFDWNIGLAKPELTCLHLSCSTLTMRQNFAVCWKAVFLKQMCIFALRAKIHICLKKCIMLYFADVTVSTENESVLVQMIHYKHRLAIKKHLKGKELNLKPSESLFETVTWSSTSISCSFSNIGGRAGVTDFINFYTLQILQSQQVQETTDMSDFNKNLTGIKVITLPKHRPRSWVIPYLEADFHLPG